MERVNNKMAYAEIFELLEIFGNDYKKKIPADYYKFIVEEKPEKYDVKKVRRDVENDKLSEDALKLLTSIYLEYFVEDELAKKAYGEIINSKIKEKKDKKIPKINQENIKTDIFADRKVKKEQLVDDFENKEVIQYEKIGLFKKIINKIKKILNK